MVALPPKLPTYSEQHADRIVPNGVCYYESVACSRGPVSLIYGNHDPFPACDWHAAFGYPPARLAIHNPHHRKE